MNPMILNKDYLVSEAACPHALNLFQDNSFGFLFPFKNGNFSKNIPK